MSRKSFSLVAGTIAAGLLIAAHNASAQGTKIPQAKVSENRTATADESPTASDNDANSASPTSPHRWGSRTRRPTPYVRPYYNFYRRPSVYYYYPSPPVGYPYHGGGFYGQGGVMYYAW